MSSLTNSSENTKSLSNASEGNADTTWNDHTETWDEATATWNSPGMPLTKTAKNNKTLTNASENT